MTFTLFILLCISVNAIFGQYFFGGYYFGSSGLFSTMTTEGTVTPHNESREGMYDLLTVQETKKEI